MSTLIRPAPIPWRSVGRKLAAVGTVLVYVAALTFWLLALRQGDVEVTPLNDTPPIVQNGPIANRVPMEVGGVPCHQCR
jgi:hypothetical protein